MGRGLTGAQVQEAVEEVGRLGSVPEAVVALRVRWAMPDLTRNRLHGACYAQGIRLGEVADEARRRLVRLLDERPPPPPRPPEPPREPPRREGPTLALLLGDLHAPRHDRGAWAAVLAWAREHRPGLVVLGGDVGEWESVSEHGTKGAWGSSLDADAASVRGLLVELREAAGPDARIVYLEGNHETRLERFLAHHAPQFLGSLTIPDKLGLADLGVEWVPQHDQPVRFGGLAVLHGHQFLGGFGMKYPTTKALDLYGAPGRSVVFFHTHKAQVGSAARMGGTVATAINLGCVCALRPQWQAGPENGWQHQIGIAYLGEHDEAAVYPVSIRGGAFVWGGRWYSGRAALAAA